MWKMQFLFYCLWPLDGDIYRLSLKTAVIDHNVILLSIRIPYGLSNSHSVFTQPDLEHGCEQPDLQNTVEQVCSILPNTGKNFVLFSAVYLLFVCLLARLSALKLCF